MVQGDWHGYAPEEPVMATWVIRAKTDTSRRRIFFLPLCLLRALRAHYSLMEDRTLLPAVHDGQQWSARNAAHAVGESGRDGASLFPPEWKGLYSCGTVAESKGSNPRFTRELSPRGFMHTGQKRDGTGGFRQTCTKLGAT